MSLIADLLAKLNRREPSGEVPPGLRRVVESDAHRHTQRRRIVLLSLVLLAVVVAGIASLFAIDRYVSAPKEQVAARLPQPAPAVPSSSADSPVWTAPAPQQPASAPERTPVEQKAQAQDQAVPELPRAEKPAESEAKPSRTRAAERPSQGIPDRRAELELHLYAAKAHEARREYQQALASYREALELDPKNFVILNNVAGTLLRLGSAGEAARFARQALTVRQDYVPAMINLGVAEVQGGSLADGELYLNKALGYDPGNRSLLMNLGLLHERRGNPERAASFYAKLAEARDVQGQLGLARIAEKQGRTADAVRYYRELLQSESVDAAAHRFANERLNALQK